MFDFMDKGGLPSMVGIDAEPSQRVDSFAGGTPLAEPTFFSLPEEEIEEQVGTEEVDEFMSMEQKPDLIQLLMQMMG